MVPASEAQIIYSLTPIPAAVFAALLSGSAETMGLLGYLVKFVSHAWPCNSCANGRNSCECAKPAACHAQDAAQPTLALRTCCHAPVCAECLPSSHQEATSLSKCRTSQTGILAYNVSRLCNFIHMVMAAGWWPGDGCVSYGILGSALRPPGAK